MTKTEHIQKLIAFTQTNLMRPSNKFVAPTPLPRDLRDALVKRMKGNTTALLDDRDVVEVSFYPASPDTISIYTALESGHNGSKFDAYNEEVHVFDEFLDFAISVLRNRVSNIIFAQLEAEENQRKQLRVEARMRELGL